VLGGDGRKESLFESHILDWILPTIFRLHVHAHFFFMNDEIVYQFIDQTLISHATPKIFLVPLVQQLCVTRFQQLSSVSET
jgi:hypothetical protein